MPDGTARPSLTPANPERAQAIHRAAIALFAERGYRATTINDIADRMGIRGPSLYKHVTSKQEILSDVIVSVMEQVLAGQSAAAEQHAEPAEQLRAMATELTLYHVADPARAFVCNRELHALEEPARSQVHALRDEYWKRLRTVIEAGNATGAFAVSRSAVTTFSLVEMMVGVAAWYSESVGPGPDEVADQVAMFALRMVGWRG